MDRAKVIKWLELCEIRSGDRCYETECPYYRQECRVSLKNDILELLKEQEEMEPIFIENPYTHLPVSYCPKCREPIDRFVVGNPYKEIKYCHYCGQAVKWDES